MNLLVWFLLHVDCNALTSEFDPDFIIKTSTDTAKGERVRQTCELYLQQIMYVQEKLTILQLSRHNVDQNVNWNTKI